MNLKEFSKLTKRSEFFTLTILIILFAMIRYLVNPDLDVEFYFGGDSANRARVTFDLLEYEFHWLMGGFWLPFHFILFSIPLLISKSIFSLLIFQLFLSCISFYIFYYLIKHLFGQLNAFISTLIVGLSGTHIVLSTTMMSEVSFLLLVILSLFFASLYLNKSKQFHFYLSALFIAAAALIRYEGLFILILLMTYFAIFTNNYRHILIAVILYLIPFSLYEYAAYQDTNILLHGLTTNGEESGLVNTLLLGGETLLKRIYLIFDILLYNNGLFIIFALFNLKISFKKKDLFLYQLVAFLSLAMVLFGSIQGNIAIFSRYWITATFLLTPIGINFFAKAFTFLSIKKSKLRYIIPIIFLGVITSSLYHGYNRYNPRYFKSLGIQKFTTNFIKKYNPTKETKIFFDDAKALYAFDAYYLYFRTKNIPIECCNINNDNYIKSKFTFDTNIQKELWELESKNNFNYFFVFKNSVFHKFLIENDYQLKNKKLFLLEEENRLLLYSTQETKY